MRVGALSKWEVDNKKGPFPALFVCHLFAFQVADEPPGSRSITSPAPICSLQRMRN
jgi:hypothetical protein